MLSIAQRCVHTVARKRERALSVPQPLRAITLDAIALAARGRAGGVDSARFSR